MGELMEISQLGYSLTVLFSCLFGALVAHFAGGNGGPRPRS